MLRSKETPVANEPKPTSPTLTSTEVKPEPIPEKKESPKPPVETSVEKAKNRLAEAENYLKEKNYILATFHYINTITNAKNAIETKLNCDTEMFKLIDQSIRTLLTIASEQNDLFEKCQADAKVKLALTLSILCKDDNFKKNIPIFNEPGNEDKISPLFKILQNKELLIAIVEKHQDIAELYTKAMKLTLKHLADRKPLEGQIASEEKKPFTVATYQGTQPKNDSNLSIASNRNGIFSTLNNLKRPVALSVTGVIPGMALYSMANAGLSILLWGAFYGLLSTGVPVATYYAGHKLAEYCKGKKPGPG